jgi:hypothetical protein
MEEVLVANMYQENKPRLTRLKIVSFKSIFSVALLPLNQHLQPVFDISVGNYICDGFALSSAVMTPFEIILSKLAAIVFIPYLKIFQKHQLTLL